MQPHQERVVAESNELSERLAKLTAFIGSNIYFALDDADKELLKSQRILMAAYLDVLGRRIARFA